MKLVLNRGFLFITFGSAFLCGFPCFAFAADLELNWSCPQTEGTHAPLRRMVPVPFDSAAVKADFAAVKDFIGALQSQDSGSDYFGCLSGLLDSFWNTATAACGTPCPPEKLKKLGEGYSSLRSLIAQYGQKAFTRGALSPFKPMGIRRTDAQQPAPTTAALLSNIKQGCGKGLTPEYLDRDVMSGLRSFGRELSDYCSRSLITAYSNLLLQASSPKDFCKGEAEARCKERDNDIREAVAQLTAAGLSPVVLNPFDGDRDSSVCTMDMGLLSSQLRAVIRATEDAGKCVKLDHPGQRRRIWGDQGSTVESRYLLEALEPTYSGGKTIPNYRAIVGLSFVDDRGNPNEKLDREYKQKARECYRAAAPKLLGPNGEALALTLADDVPDQAEHALACQRTRGIVGASSEACEAVAPPVIIQIARDSGFRSHSTCWEKGIDCATILHETMHLLGLVDEYAETTAGARMEKDGTVKFVEDGAKIPEYDCRAPGPDDSLMSHQWGAYQAARMSKFLGIFGLGKERKSLLLGAQFRSIVAPGCSAENELYYLCASNAYRTSRANFGQGCAPEGDLPACRDGRWSK